MRLLKMRTYYEMATPTIAKIWRAQARRCILDDHSYEPYIIRSHHTYKNVLASLKS